MGLTPLTEKRHWLWLLLLLTACSVHAPASGPAQPVVWHPWSDAVFVQAKREHKFVLLDLEAVWCHWCHVMDKETYRDPAVQHVTLRSKSISTRARTSPTVTRTMAGRPRSSLLPMAARS
jgi:hypothetical protein